MATLNINGQRVKVDDSFLSLSPEQQNATVDEIAQSLGGQAKVDPATNQPAGVPEFVPPGVEGYNPQTGEVTRQFGRAGSAAMGAADTATFGFGDEAASYLGSALTGVPREQVLREMRGNQAAAQEQNPGSYLTGQLAGGVAQGAGLAGGGLSLAANAARAGQGLGRVALGGAADGLVLGGIHGAGSGTDAAGRAKGALVSGAVGGALGLGAPYAVAGVQAAARPVLTPLMARIRPGNYAERAMMDGLRRSGQSTDDIANMLTRAQADDQAMFNVADAMGHSGQRMLSTVARNPNNMRQTAVDKLTDRQMGQGERLAQFLAEGFDAPDTAAQRTAGLTSARDTAANRAYEMARHGLTPDDFQNAVIPKGGMRAYLDSLPKPRVDVADVIQAIDERIGHMEGSGVTGDSIDEVLRQFRNRLAVPKDKLDPGMLSKTLSDFDRVLGVKKDLRDAIEVARRAGQNNRARELGKVHSILDQALEAASPAYRTANDQFAKASRVIEAVERGTRATSGRTRAADNIREFQAMTAGERQAFRSGYADPLIARVENAAVSPSTNKARPLMTGKTGQEFPVFAAPGRADQMGNRIAREQRMFETANTALGGSKTADNLADAAEMSKFDPGVMMNLLRGRPIQAAVDAVAKIANEAKGMPPSVMDRLARMLLETRPDVARAMLSGATARQAVTNGRRALANAILINMGSVGAGRLAAP